MFDSLLKVISYETDDEGRENLPNNCYDLRILLVNELLANPRQYNFNDKSDKKLLKLMLNPGQQPCSEVLLAACHLLNLEIFVYH